MFGAAELIAAKNVRIVLKFPSLVTTNFDCMRLLSFLSDIEKAVAAESPVIEGGAWEASRMVNFAQGLGRVVLTPRVPAELPLPGGSIFLQAFALADGSQCMKATLSWQDSTVTTTRAVYSTPTLNWKLEASKIATAFLEGPPASASADSFPTQGLTPLSATG